jgi:putative ABC transport system permease protein
MRWIARCRAIVNSGFKRHQAEMDLEQELQSHLEQEIASNLRAGMPDEEAIAAARQLIGSLSLHKEGCRDARATASLESFGRDLRYGWRVLAKDRGFFATASVALALGIGASATLFSLVESQLWQPLPFPDPGRLVVIWKRNLKAKWQQTPASAADFAVWRERTRSFEKMAAMGWPGRRNFVGNGVTDRPQVAAISSGFFETLRTPLAAGRPFEASNEESSKQAKAIMSERLAERAFGSSKAALGKTIRLNGQPYTVSGVMGRAFRLEVTRTADVFVPLTIHAASNKTLRASRELVVIGRLRKQVSSEQALADTAAVAQSIAAEHPDTNANFSVAVERLDKTFTADSTRTWLLLSFGFSIFVLLIACANVAGLQLMRSVVRQREFAVREALGASKLAMIRQRIAESGWIATMGAVSGSLLAYGGVQAMRAAPMQKSDGTGNNGVA